MELKIVLEVSELLEKMKKKGNNLQSLETRQFQNFIWVRSPIRSNVHEILELRNFHPF